MIAIALTVLLYGCAEGDERNHPLFRKAESAQRTGNAAEAVSFYKELLNRRGNCVYTHLKLAEIYDELLKDPQLAALHYRLYLEAMPDAPDAEEIKAWQKNAEKRYYESLSSKFAPQQPPAAQIEIKPDDLADSQALPPGKKVNTEASTPQPNDSTVDKTELTKLRSELAESKDKLAQFRARYRFMQIELNRLRSIERAFNALQQKSAKNSTYQVQPGDTLGKIALKCYGKSSLYYLIEKANPGVNSNRLRTGTVLIIPEYKP